jgi:hypothetical protein
MDERPPGSAASAGASLRELTFRGNLKTTRHGWLRLTPAYSVRLVEKLLASSGAEPPLLDPFCGTGTTLLSCTERGLDCDTADINPFLIWLARSKLGSYSRAQLDEARSGLSRMTRAARSRRTRSAWAPPIHRIERWWDRGTLAALGRAFEALERLDGGASRPARNLLRVAFCQALIERSSAHFRHQSLSFGKASNGAIALDEPSDIDAAERVADSLDHALERLLATAAHGLPSTRRRVYLADARRLHERLPNAHYGAVITSPPYANRMSYIRELRPYMYWLKYLEDRTGAGVLDWRAIGGTWGVATSNLSTWTPETNVPPLGADIEGQLRAIAERSPVLANYVRKYFHDMFAHLNSLARVLRRGASAHYVVGNSKFYDVVVPVEQVLATQFEQAGFGRVEIETLRKRSSKKELYEFLMRARL